MSQVQEVVAVSCSNASGESDLFVTKVTVEPFQLDNGEHYDIACAEARDDDYESTGVAYDSTELRNLRNGLIEAETLRAEIQRPAIDTLEFRDHVASLIESASAWIIGDSPLLSEIDTDDADEFFFNWHDSDGDLFTEAVPVESLRTAVFVAPGHWQVKTNLGDMVDLKIYNLEPAQ